MWKQSSQPVPLRNHVGIQSGHETGSASRHAVNLIEPVIKVTSFEMMWDALGLRPASVPQIRILVTHVLHGLAERGISTVVQYDDPELVGRVVNFASCSCRIHYYIHLLFAASYEAVNIRDVFAFKTQLRSLPPLKDEHVPQGLNE